MLALIPPDISWLTAIGLVGLSFFTSMLTGALGLGGGVLMIAVLALVLPAPIVIPVHGVVQLGSNLGRAVLMRQHVDRGLLVPFALGSLVGLALAAPLVIALPREILQALIALFVLWSLWSPKLKPSRIPRALFVLVGGVTSFATMFLGATGPLVAAFINPDRLGRHGVVATHAACMTLQHGFKIGAFTVLGFAFLEWLPLLAAMIGLGFLGTKIGNRMLDRLSEVDFARSFRLVVSGLAVLLLIRSATDLLPG